MAAFSGPEIESLGVFAAECDENLCAPNLTPDEKAMFTARRKEAYEALHGPAKAIGARAANLAMGKGDASANLADAFSTDTAAKTGDSERTVQRNAERGERIDPKALDAVRGTELDRGAYLDKLKSLPPEEQAAKVRTPIVLAGTSPPE